MKLPYSKSHYLLLKENHKLQVKRIRRMAYDSKEYKEQLEYLNGSFSAIMQYENAENFNKYAKNICMFNNSEDTFEVCEREFKNTFYIYSTRGNCCDSCNSVFNSKNYTQ